MAITNHERVGKALELLKNGLDPFIECEIMVQFGLIICVPNGSYQKVEQVSYDQNANTHNAHKGGDQRGFQHLS